MSVPQRPNIQGDALFQASSISALEEYLTKLASHNEVVPFDLSMALALLRLYNFFPDRVDENVICHVLGMALGEPSHEAVFLSCRYLIPDPLAAVPAIASLISLADLLDTAQFPAFWKTWPTIPAAPWNHAALLQRIRANITDVVAKTYDVIAADVFSSNIGLVGDELTKFSAEQGFEAIDGGLLKSDHLLPSCLPLSRIASMFLHGRIPRARYPSASLAATNRSTGPSIPTVAAIAAVINSTRDAY